MFDRSIERITARLLRFARRPFIVRLARRFGARPNQRDKAEAFGRNSIRQAFAAGRPVVIDFKDTGLITQGFFHALLDECITEDPRRAGDITLVNVNQAQKSIFDLAMRYMVKTAAPRTRQVPATPARFIHPSVS